MSRRRKIILGGLGIVAAGFLIIQVIPVGSFKESLKRDLNPPVITHIDWDSPETEQLMRAACFDCHSNETVWPIYSQIAPISWLITRDVNFGRDAMNLSEESADAINVDDIEWHLNNNMPPRKYLLLHPEAQLTTAQKAALMEGLRATFGSSGQSSMEGMQMDTAPASTPDSP